MWKAQRSKRRGRWYGQVIWSGAGPKVSATLGYLDEHGDPEEVWDRVKASCADAPTPDRIVVTVDDHHGVLPTDPVAIKDAIKAWVLDDTSSFVTATTEQWAAEDAQRKIDAGDYASLTLREYHARVWAPVRERDYPGSWKREQRLWPPILKGLGGVKMGNLDATRWHLWIESQTTWGTTMRRLAKNAYRVCLKHAVSIGVLDAIHPMPTIVHANKRERDPRPFTMDEIERILAVMEPRDRAMTCVGIHQCLRPAELYRLRWEDITWAERLLHVHGTKTDASDRVSPIMPASMDVLRGWWEDNERPTHGVIFQPKGKDTPLKAWRFKLKYACMAAGIEGGKERAYPYLLRHTGACLHAVNGLPKILVASLGGWKMDSTVLETAYQQVGGKTARALLDQWLATKGAA